MARAATALNRDGVAGSRIQDLIPGLQQNPTQIWERQFNGAKGHYSLYFDREPAKLAITTLERSADFGAKWGIERSVTRQGTIGQIGLDQLRGTIEFRPNSGSGYRNAWLFDPKDHPAFWDGRPLHFDTLILNRSGRIDYFSTVDNVSGRPRWRF